MRRGHCVRFYGPGPASVPRPTFAVASLGDATATCDEFSATTIVFKWIHRLEKLSLPQFHLRVMPLLNPDGMLQARGQRANARGVDLNRNLPTRQWDEEAIDAERGEGGSS